MPSDATQKPEPKQLNTGAERTLWSFCSSARSSDCALLAVPATFEHLFMTFQVATAVGSLPRRWFTAQPMRMQHGCSHSRESVTSTLVHCSRVAIVDAGCRL